MLTIWLFKIIKLSLKAPWSPLTHCGTQWLPLKRKWWGAPPIEPPAITGVINWLWCFRELFCLVSASHCDYSTSKVAGPHANFCLSKATLEIYATPNLSKSSFLSCINKIINLQRGLSLWHVYELWETNAGLLSISMTKFYL